MVGVNTFLEALNRRADTRQLTLTTETLAGGQTHDFQADIEDPKVESIDFRPDDVGIPQEGVIFVVRPLIISGSTDTDFLLFEDDSRNDIDEILRISTIDANDSAQTFQPGSGTGVQFENQNGENEWYFRLVENSSTDAKFKVRMRWLDVGALGA
jgi:hypothetical protein